MPKRVVDLRDQRALLDIASYARRGPGHRALTRAEVEHVSRTARAVAAGRKPPKLVHNLVFSMPKGTPPDKVHAAVRKFATEKFALQHRYAMALHTDQGNPHVHVVVKAVSEQGERLNIRKATLREWRQDFARYLRDLGVEANATERAVRGEVRPQKATGIHRAMMRGASTLWRERAQSVARELASGGPRPEPGRERLVDTRRDVVRGWNAMAQLLDEQGHRELATVVRRFVERMPPPQSEREWIGRELQARVARARDGAARLP
jgi:hypothetical protein